MADATVRIEGLEATEHAFESAALEAPVELRVTLFRGGEMIARFARAQAALRGDIGVGDHGDPSRHSGDLIGKISVYPTMRGAAVVERSRTRTKKYPGGYPYPRRIEYEEPGRAFMRPAADLGAPVVQEMVDRRIDELFREKGF